MGVVLFSVQGIDQFERGRVGRSAPSGCGGRRDAVRATAVPVGNVRVDVIGGADDPDRSRLTRRPVAPNRADLDLLDCA